MINQTRLLVVGLAIVVLAITAAACGDDDDDVGSQLVTIQATLEELVESSQRGHVLATMTTIRTEGLHDIDDAAQQASEIEAGWSGAITRMRQAVGGTDWPDELSADAAHWYGKLIAAEDAIDSGDLAASKTAISEAHAAWHGIEHPAYQFIAGDEVTGGAAHGDDEEVHDEDDVDETDDGGDHDE
jgi:hypothetical protein